MTAGEASMVLALADSFFFDVDLDYSESKNSISRISEEPSSILDGKSISESASASSNHKN